MGDLNLASVLISPGLYDRWVTALEVELFNLGSGHTPETYGQGGVLSGETSHGYDWIRTHDMEVCNAML